MAIAVKPTAFAQATGTDPSGLHRALERGESYQGWPVSSWAVRTPDSFHLNVPESVAEGYGLRGIREQRTNPAPPVQLAASNGRTWPDAVAETAVPVAANVGTATVLHRYADVIDHHPDLFVRLTDLVAFLGGVALVGAFTDSDTNNRALKVMAGGVGGYAAWSAVQMVQEEARHRREMEQMQYEAWAAGHLPATGQLPANGPPEAPQLPDQLPESTHFRRLGA